MAVIRPVVETDPAELEKIALDYLKVAMPAWEPADGDLMSWLIGAHARMVAEERDLAADVPLEQILRPLGEQVHRVWARLPTPAVADARVTLLDRAGYTIPAGMEVLVRTSGDDGVTMVVDQTVTVKPEDDTDVARVRLRAAPGREGAEGNGLDSNATVIPLRALEFVKEIRLTTTSSGGSDGETDEEYYQRLVDTLALTSELPVLANDFAAIARQHPSVGRALALNRHLWRPEVIDVRTTAAATSYQLEALPVVRIGSALTAEEVRSAFVSAGFTATAEPAPGNVTGRADQGIRVSLSGRATYGTWKVVGSGELAIVQLGGERNAVEHAVAVAVCSQNGLRLSATDRAAVQQMLEERRELNWKVSVIDPTYTAIDVVATAVPWPSYDPSTVQTSADAAVRDFLSPARWGQGENRTDSANVEWIDEPVVRYLEVAQALNNVPGLRYLTALTIGVQGGAQARDDVPLRGLAPLPTAGTGISIRVVEG